MCICTYIYIIQVINNLSNALICCEIHLFIHLMLIPTYLYFEVLFWAFAKLASIFLQYHIIAC